MTKNELGLVYVVAGLGAAAYFLLRATPTKADGSAWQPHFYGTGTALKEPVPTAVEEPGIFESIVRMIMPAETSSGYKDPTQWRNELRPLFRQLEHSYAMPAGLLEAVAEKESAFRHDIITCETLGGVGEEGIMQLRPEFHLSSRAERCNPQIAIPYAAKYLAKNFMKFGTWSEAVAAYNWGPSNVERSGINAAPASTKRYIAFVKERSEDFA